MLRAVSFALSLLLAVSGFCTNLCATQALAELQHACCPHHHDSTPGEKSCDHAVSAPDSQDTVKHISMDLAPASLAQPLIFNAPPVVPSSPAPSAVIADISPQRHFILRL